MTQINKYAEQKPNTKREQIQGLVPVYYYHINESSSYAHGRDLLGIAFLFSALSNA